MPRVFPGCRAGNIGSCLFMALLLLKQILISLKGGNLISGRRSTGEIKFHMGKQAEFCVFLQLALEKPLSWIYHSHHGVAQSRDGHAESRSTKVLLRGSQTLGSGRTYVDFMASGYSMCSVFGDQSSTQTPSRKFYPTTRPVKMLVRERKRQRFILLFKIKDAFPIPGPPEKHELSLTAVSMGSPSTSRGAVQLKPG